MSRINEFIGKAKEFIGKIGMGITYKEESRKMKGEFFIKLQNSDGTVEERHIENVITEDASLLIARLLADGQTTVDPSGPAHGIYVLAVGSGSNSWPDKNNPPPPTPQQHNLFAELARKTFSNVSFITPGGSGLPASTVTNIIDFQTVFNESEAVGGITELAMFGGDASDVTPNSGLMVNFRTVPIVNKSNTSTLSIIFRLTT